MSEFESSFDESIALPSSVGDDLPSRRDMRACDGNVINWSRVMSGVNEELLLHVLLK